MATQDAEKLCIAVKKPVTDYKGPDDNTYQMVKKPRGVCLIVSIEKFDAPPGGGRPHEAREGGDVDRENLKELFEQLGFLVEVVPNGTAEEIGARCKEIRVAIQ